MNLNFGIASDLGEGIAVGAGGAAQAPMLHVPLADSTLVATPDIDVRTACRIH